VAAPSSTFSRKELVASVGPLVEIAAGRIAALAREQ
jgi:hypothetical protein